LGSFDSLFALLGPLFIQACVLTACIGEAGFKTRALKVYGHTAREHC
jgi:hypothetical protein